MIEFNGCLTGVSQKYFCNQIVKCQRIFILFTSIPAIFIICLYGYLFWGVSI